MVFELFTALGCSDTPPADMAFAEVVEADHINLIALSCHVTTFNNSRPDPLSSEFCDFRHKSYERALEAMTEAQGVPYAVINGTFNNRGNKSHIVRDALSFGHALDSIIRIQMTMGAENVSISLPDLRLNRPAEVWLLAYDQKRDIVRATGQRAPYRNYITSGQKLLDWNGTYRNLNISQEMFPAEGYAVIAQDKDTMEIVAAGKIERD